MKKLVIICGPTASGKTRLAIDVAKKIGGEIISADSVAIYKGLDIGSAKPTAEERAEIPHHLIDIVSPEETFSVSDYEASAMKAIEDVFSREKQPVICGGTGFYINSVIYDMSYGKTAASPEIRAKYEALAKQYGREYVYDVLKKVDPKTAHVLHPNDAVRVIRALEIYEGTGIRKSDIKDEMTPRFDCRIIMTSPEREELYRNIDARVDRMFASGLEREVRGLLDEGITLKNQCMQAIGYKETAEAILKEEEMPVETIKLNSRHYAKRQITFFKRYESAIRYDEKSGDRDKILKFIEA